MICGANCGQCPFSAECKGCPSPFGEPCLVEKHIRDGSYSAFRGNLIQAFRSLGIAELQGLTELYPLCGRFVNLEYPVAGRKIKLLNDDRIYLGNQLEREKGDRCYGVVTDGTFLLVCEYGENGTDAQLVLYKRLEVL